MPHDHPTHQDLASFLRGHHRPEDRPLNARIVRHLLADCPTCQQEMKVAGARPERLRHLFGLPVPPAAAGCVQSSSSEYETAFAKAERSLSAFFERGIPVREPPGELLAELFPLLSEEEGGSATDEKRAAIPQLVKWLIGRSQASRYHDPERMLHWARMARLAVDACTPSMVGGERKLADLQGTAWRQFGNALRVSGWLHEAEAAMALAKEHLQKGTDDPSLAALLLNQMASLRIFERKFESAQELLQEAEEIQRDLGDRQELAGTLVQRAVALLYSGDPPAASAVLEQAVPLIDSKDDPHLLLTARHNLLCCYIDMGRQEEALALYFEVRELSKRFQDPLIQLRIGWQEGKLLRGLGHLREAEEKLLDVRRGFLQRGLAYEVAIVSLDLAEVYAKMGRVDEVNQLVGETVPIFRALRIGRELLATLIQLRQTAHQERKASDCDLS